MGLIKFESSLELIKFLKMINIDWQIFRQEHIKIPRFCFFDMRPRHLGLYKLDLEENWVRDAKQYNKYNWCTQEIPARKADGWGNEDPTYRFVQNG